jgi:hypothetical protein
MSIVARSEESSLATLVGKALNADRFVLETFPVLSELPPIEQWTSAHPRELLCRGKALQALLRRAVADVASSYAKEDDTALRRLAEYVRLRYQEGMSVTEIAKRWQMNRSGVSHRFSGRAVQLIAHRFEQLVHVIRCSVEDRTRVQAT